MRRETRELRSRALTRCSATGPKRRNPSRTGTSAPNPSTVVCDRRAGLYCAYDDDTFNYSCQPLVGAGGPCDDYDSCPDGYYCDVTCVPKLPAGAPCDAYGQCADGLACVDDVCAVPKLTDGDICEGDVT